jgi:hypothetical protein
MGSLPRLSLADNTGIAWRIRGQAGMLVKKGQISIRNMGIFLPGMLSDEISAIFLAPNFR